MNQGFQEYLNWNANSSLERVFFGVLCQEKTGVLDYENEGGLYRQRGLGVFYSTFHVG